MQTLDSGRFAGRLLVVAVGVALLVAAAGCASTPAGKAVTGPGTPDAAQLAHCDQMVATIEARNRTEALAAIALMEADVYRWHVNALVLVDSLHDLIALTDLVNDEKWDEANQKIGMLKLKYGRP